ncbi:MULTISPECIES: conjugal transfer protein TraP [Rosenbergiella]|uniref:conjugal transfer protein TraP n=1 Tax=Rosenbergiella TaxID=1356488 RepID=UPI001F503132|nr:MULTISPECIES: conjugal transfer protein TraP [Rosenbergiella]
MNEFEQSPSSDGPTLPSPQHKPKKDIKYLMTEKQYFMGLTGVWLAGIAVVLCIFAFYLLSSNQPSSPDVNDLAGLQDTQVDTPAQANQNLPQSQPTVDDSQVRNEVAQMVNGVKEYSQTNRQAIERLSQTVQTLSSQVVSAQQMTQQYQEQINSLNSRIAELETNRVNGYAPRQVARHSPTASMHVSAIDNGMAWILWSGKTWAVKEGDSLGRLTVTQIDAPNRQVFTTAGVIR